jgi:hypothetical protein
VAEHASRLVAELIGEAFVTAIDRSKHRSVERARAAWRWVREVAQAPPGLELLSPDGTRYTGLVIVERSQVLYMLALRHAPSPSSTRHPHEPLYPDHEQELWLGRDRGPYSR